MSKERATIAMFLESPKKTKQPPHEDVGVAE